MRNNPFEAEFGKSLRKLEEENDSFAYHRLYDTKTFRQASENIFCIRQPADYFAVNKGRIFFLELKSSKNPHSFSLRFVPEHQIESLQRFSKAGSKSYIIICNRSTQRDYKAYAISIFNFHLLRKYLDRSDKKSIKWKELTKFSFELKRLPGSMWDLSKLFDLD